MDGNQQKNVPDETLPGDTVASKPRDDSDGSSIPLHSVPPVDPASKSNASGSFSAGLQLTERSDLEGSQQKSAFVKDISDNNDAANYSKSTQPLLPMSNLLMVVLQKWMVLSRGLSTPRWKTQFHSKLKILGPMMEKLRVSFPLLLAQGSLLFFLVHLLIIPYRSYMILRPILGQSLL